MPRLQSFAREPEAHSGEGPFVSFTDLLAGVVFMLLIMVALLILRQQRAIDDLKGKIDPAVVEQQMSELRQQKADLIVEKLKLLGDLNTARQAKADADSQKKALYAALDAAIEGKRVVESQKNALESAKAAMEADFRKSPRLHAAMVYNEYDRFLTEGVPQFHFARTVAVYLNEDRTRYTSFEIVTGDGQLLFANRPPPSTDYAKPPELADLHGECRMFDRSQWHSDCNEKTYWHFTRAGNAYVGRHRETRDGQTGNWDVRIEILAIYDDYFR